MVEIVRQCNAFDTVYIIIFYRLVILLCASRRVPAGISAELLLIIFYRELLYCIFERVTHCLHVILITRRNRYLYYAAVDCPGSLHNIANLPTLMFQKLI